MVVLTLVRVSSVTRLHNFSAVSVLMMVEKETLLKFMLCCSQEVCWARSTDSVGKYFYCILQYDIELIC